jgi:four helix bundle protein
MAKGDDIQARLMVFASEALDICDQLPKTTEGNQIVGQLLRSATSAASNYAEARGAESRNDFIHKLCLLFKELNESEVWLELVLARGIVAEVQATEVLQHCKALCRIVGASRRTARENELGGQKAEKPEAGSGSSGN